jgi:hypothetical protein
MEKRDINQSGLLVAGLAATSFIAGCDKSADQWSNAPGTHGLINLDAVKQAFVKDPNVDQFETRVNEIFEGDNLVMCTSKAVNGGFLLTGAEDLDEDGKTTSKDEVLFTLTVAKGRATLQGNGVNGYYKESWPYNPPKKEEYTQTPSTYRHYPHFHYWYWGRGWGGYYTPFARYDSIFSHRNDYRTGSAYSSQISQNTDFENRMSSKYGSGFRNSVVGGGSPTRKDYINTKKSSPDFKNTLKSNQKSAAWSQRSKSSKSSSFSSAKSPSKSSRGSSYSRSGRSGSRGFRGFRGSSGFGV